MTLLQRLRDVGVNALPPPAQQRHVSRILHQRVLEDVARHWGCAALMDQFSIHQLAKRIPQ
jgi:hypothetical protein